MPSRIALLIGTNYANSSDELFGCVNDVQNMKTFLQDKCNFDSRDIRVLTNAGASRAAILRALGQLKDFDQIFVHYSGHGSSIRDQSGDELDGKDEVIVPHDYQSHGIITDDELHSFLVALPATTQGIFVFDACHSGTVLDLKYRFVPGRKNLVVENRKSRVLARLVMFSGCQDAQVSMDAYLSGKYAGAMTWAFLKTLKTSNSKIKLSDFVKNIGRLLNGRGFSQKPQLSGTRKAFRDYLFTLSTGKIGMK
jgi:hypothetical protein